MSLLRELRDKDDSLEKRVSRLEYQSDLYDCRITNIVQNMVTPANRSAAEVAKRVTTIETQFNRLVNEVRELQDDEVTPDDSAAEVIGAKWVSANPNPKTKRQVVFTIVVDSIGDTPFSRCATAAETVEDYLPIFKNTLNEHAWAGHNGATFEVDIYNVD